MLYTCPIYIVFNSSTHRKDGLEINLECLRECGKTGHAEPLASLAFCAKVHKDSFKRLPSGNLT